MQNMHFSQAFFIIFKGLSGATNCLRPEKAPLNFEQRKHFAKTINQREFGYGFFTKLPRLIVARDFLLLLLQAQNTYPTSLDKISIITWALLAIIKPKSFLRNKLLENSHLTKYLTSVTEECIFVDSSL